MQRRIMAVLLWIGLMLSLGACGNDNENPTNTPSPEEQTLSNTQIKSESEIIETNEFSKGVVKRKVQNVDYLVPQAWKTEDGDDGRTTFYYPKDVGSAPFMMVQFKEFINRDFSITDDGFFSDYITGLNDSDSQENFSLLKKNIQTTALGISCGYVEYSCTINNVDLIVKLAVFDCQNGLVSFWLGMPSSETADYTNDYYRVLNSVEVMEYPAQGAIGEYYVSIGDCSFTTDYNGNKVIVINYDFTNNSSETVAPIWEVRGKAFQDGVQLESAVVINNSAYDAGIEQKNIRPGISLPGCQVAYVLTSDSPVEFEMGAMFGKPVLTKTFDVR